MAQVEQFPLFRIASLLTQRLSSPISKKLKVCAHHHPRFGTTICARVGRWYRAGELRFKLWMLQLPAPRCPVAVSDREAIDIGTDILGEATIFALGSMIIIYEVNRQVVKNEAKILDKRSHWVAILTALEELKIEVEIQQKEIDLLLAAIRKLDPDVPLPSTLTKPLHVPDSAPELAASPALLSTVTAPPLSSLPLTIPKATPDEVAPLPDSPPSSPPAPHPPTDSPPPCPPEGRFNSVWLVLLDLAEED